MNSYRPSNNGRRGGGRDDNRSRFDAPHPPPPGTEPWRRPPSPSRQPPYDSYRSRYDNSRPPPPPPGSFDGYREHRPPQGDFTFRVPNPPGITSGPDSYRPDQNNNTGPPRRGDRGGRGRGHGRGHTFRGRGGYPRIIPAERELLRKQQGQVQEHLVTGHSTRYRDPAELSDDEEAAMEISDESDDDDEGQPSRKRARHSGPSGDVAFAPSTSAGAVDGTNGANAVNKWSNPDADTALPPEASQRKKKDMVQLIRKARLDDDSASKLNASTEAEEFISFDNFGVEGGAREPAEPAPSSSQKTAAPSQTLAAPPPDALGSRKRTFDDEIKPPTYGPLRKTTKMPVQGHVVPEWEPTDDEDPCPWVDRDHSQTSDMSVWLHKEICDFYYHVAPRKFEQRMRGHLVERLEDSLRKNHKYRGCEVRPFGSYMSGLYLPTADMDLVICSKEWRDRGMSAFPSASSLFKFKNFLLGSKLAEPSSIEVISKAKVPLVKYIDAVTGLRVDISFDRMDGPAAIGTFLRWKQQYPALPTLVTIIKHFLVMRGLNEPVNGGIGSFSVSCMVMSMLQLMPQVQSRTIVPEHHLGELLMEFFDLYGNKFDFKENAIRINPPGYVPKNSRTHSLVYKKRDRLSIIDPNNSSNDIAGGSSNIDVIMYDFHCAHRMIKERMAEVASGEDLGTGKISMSILETILAGNYSSFHLQRAHLRHLHEKRIGPCED